MGSGQKSLTQVRSDQFFVTHGWVWVWKISPKNVKFFNVFPSGQKNSSGQVKKYSNQRWVSALIYCGSKVISRRVRVHL